MYQLREDYKPVGEKVTIKQARESQGMSQQELATKVYLSIPAISRMENGHPVLKSNVLRVCDALGIKIEDVTGVVYRAQRAK